MAKTRLIIISDIHIGIDAPTNWYQSSVHAPYLIAVLEDVIARADEILELLILGDLFDTWTYEPRVAPPTYAEIIQHPANADVMNLLRKAVDALDGRVSVVQGNHDMTLTQADLFALRGPITGRYPILRPETYMPSLPTVGPNAVVTTHGHRFSMLCARDHQTANSIDPLGIGWYVTRVGAYMAAEQLRKTGQPNVAHLPNQGAPTGLQITPAQYAEIIGDLFIYSLGGAITKVIQAESNLSWTAPILRHDQRTVNLNTCFHEYAGLLETWENKRYPNGERYGRTGAFYALKLPDVDNDLSWYAQLLAGHYNAAVVVMGHTHVPEYEFEVREQGSNSGKFLYANSGFNCPSIPDMGKGKHPTYVEIQDIGGTLSVVIKSVHPSDGAYVVVDEPAFDIEVGTAGTGRKTRTSSTRRATRTRNTAAKKKTAKKKPAKKKPANKKPAKKAVKKKTANKKTAKKPAKKKTAKQGSTGRARRRKTRG